MLINTTPVRVDHDGLAVIGTTPNMIRGIRLAEGEDSTPPAPAPDDDPNDADATDVIDQASADLLAAAQSRIAELEMTVADLEASLTKVQAHNYQLLIGTPAGTTDSTADNSQSAMDPDEVIDPMDVFFEDEDND